MEGNNIEVIDCMKIIWKRKILIIVCVLVSIVAGFIMNSRKQVSYRAESLISIGKKIIVSGRRAEGVVSSIVPGISFVLVEEPKTMVESIPAKYYKLLEEYSGSNVSAVTVQGTELIRIKVEAPTKKATEGLINGILEQIIASHSIITDTSVLCSQTINTVKLKQEQTAIEEVTRLKRALTELKEGENDKALLVLISENLSKQQLIVKEIQDELAFYGMLGSSIKQYKTKVIGNSDVTTIYIKGDYVKKAGGLGLVISLLLAFFMEYTVRIKNEKREEG
jgi:capsular polysaccharide biosynthesis protein